MDRQPPPTIQHKKCSVSVVFAEYWADGLMDETGGGKGRIYECLQQQQSVHDMASLVWPVCIWVSTVL
jgi:hypothetical protein